MRGAVVGIAYGRSAKEDAKTGIRGDLRRRRILFLGFLLHFFAFSCMIEEVITGFATQNGKDGILCSLFQK